MSKDVECPYCGFEQDINHDDGQGYDEGVYHEQQCDSCGKTFTFQTEVHFSYEVAQADCLNGGEHELEPVVHFPHRYQNWVRCKNCEYENRGDT